MDNTDIPKHKITPFSIFITLLDFVLTLTSRLFDAEYIIFPVHLSVSSFREKKFYGENTFCSYFDIGLCLFLFFLRQIIQVQTLDML